MKAKKLLWVALVLMVISVLSAENIKVPFATGEWEPYTSEKLPNYGAASELVSAICKAAGITPVFEFYPWVRCEKMVESGEAFAAFPYAFTPERSQKYHFSDILFYGSDTFIYYKKNPKMAKGIKYETVNDLKPYTIGLIAGSYLIPDFEKNGLKYEVTATVDMSIKKLQAGRIDLFIDDQVVVFDAIKKTFPKEVDNFGELAKSYGERSKTGLIVSKKYPKNEEILIRFNKGLDAIKKSGEYNKITSKYKMAKS